MFNLSNPHIPIIFLQIHFNIILPLVPVDPIGQMNWCFAINVFNAPHILTIYVTRH